MRRIVITGHGVAGLTAGDALRQAGFDGELVLVGEEVHAPYSRPALSKAALSMTSPVDDAGAGTSGFAVQQLPEPAHGALEILGHRAVAVRTAERRVGLDDGSELSYDGLVVATGARARRFTNSPEEYTLRSLDDAVALRARLNQRPRLVVLGGGPLGMEVASGARGLGCEVTLVHLGTPMERQIGAFLAGVCASAAQEHGVRLIDAAARRVFSSVGHGMVVELSTGGKVAADVVVSAVGDVPNDDWLADSGLLTGGRAVVDSRNRLGPGVVAVGDVAWLATEAGLRRQPLWTSAIAQGKSAAGALLHGAAAEPLSFQPYFWTEQFGLNLRISGIFPPLGIPHVVDGDLEERQVLLRWDGAGLVGTAAAVNFRIPIPKLRRLAAAAPATV